jgi:hypothetical protein
MSTPEVLRVLAVCIVCLAGGAGWWAAPVAAAAGGGTTDPAFDWENPPAQPSRDQYAITTFKSTRTLAQTTRWLKTALERHVRPTSGPYKFEVSDVRFSGCTMEWTFRQELGGGITKVASYSVNLRDVDLSTHAVQVFTQSMRFRTKNPFTVVEKIFEKGTQKSTGTSKETVVQFELNEKFMPDRIAWATVHAARLCGAEVPPPR